jgi:ABC-type multidrug transport system fused ATPase/permease subunit
MQKAPSPSAFRRHVWPLFYRDRWLLLGALVLNGVHGAAIAVQNVTPKWLFSEVLEPKDLSDEARLTRLSWLVLAYLVVSVVFRMAAWHSGFRLFTWVRERVVFSLRGQFFRHVNHLCLRFHGEHPSGELFSYLFGTPLANVMAFFHHTSMAVMGAIVTVVATLAMFFTWDFAVALVLLVTSLSSVWLMVRARDRIQKISREFQSAEGDVSGRVADLLRGNKAVKLYAMEDHIAADFDQQALVIAKKSYERDVQSHIEYMKQETFGYLCFGALLLTCTLRYLEHSIDLGTVAACLASYAGLSGPFQTIFQAFALWGSAEASIDRIGAVLDTPSTTPDPSDPVRAIPPRATIEFERVSFSYVTGQPVLRDLTLTIPRGERIALVGPSGAGKSTIAQLLLRLYDPEAGQIRLSEHDLRDFEAAELRKAFGVVPQDPFIFRATVRDNVRVARPDATDAAIREACELSNAWEFIEKLPQGLDSHVGEGGSSLSGGQRQRLAIARALLTDPQIFIFDEATSALDSLSETLIQEALEKNLGDRTVLFIAHRLATVKNCDRILVVADGRVVQDGSYAALTEAPGLFQDLVRGQSLRD